MDHFEMVEKLRAKANVSYEDAKAALEASNWDLLDALVLLEGEGKTYTTKEETAAPIESKGKKHSTTQGWFTRMAATVSKLVAKCNVIIFEVHKNDKLVFSLPLTALILAFVFLFWIVLVLCIIGLFFNFRYSFRGEHVNESVNRAMDKASGIADSIKNNINDGKESTDK